MAVDAHILQYIIENYKECEFSDTTDTVDTDCDMYKKVLKIIIPGKVISDSRPRHSKFGHFFNPNKAELMRRFAVCYKLDTSLIKTFIVGLIKITMKVYITPTSKAVKIFSHEQILAEKLPCVGSQDNDNIEKVHYDVLQDNKFNIIFDDAWIVKNVTEKFYSYNPRIEVSIHYDHVLDNSYMRLLDNSKRYLKSLLHFKFFNYEDHGKWWVEIAKHKRVFKKEEFEELLNSYTVTDLNKLCKSKGIHIATKGKDMMLKRILINVIGDYDIIKKDPVKRNKKK